MAFKMKGNPYKLGKMATKSTMKMAKKAAMKMKPKGDVDTPMDLKKDPMMMKKESSAMKQVAYQIDDIPGALKGNTRKGRKSGKTK